MHTVLPVLHALGCLSFPLFRMKPPGLKPLHDESNAFQPEERIEIVSQANPEWRTRENILDQIDAILRSCEEAKRPLEVEPARGELFELFVSVESAGGLQEESPLNLSADGLCQSLAERWGLKNSTESWLRQNTNLTAEQMAQMRSLWSLLRMWMEWTYAWERWPDFHPEGTAQQSQSSE